MGAIPRTWPETAPDRRCPACGPVLAPHLAGARDTISGETFSVSICPECGLGVTQPQPPDLAPYYRTRYYGGRHSFTASLCLNRRKRLIARATGRPGRLLDVGCGDGSFLVAARQAGWEVAGTEIHAATSIPGCPVFRNLDEAQRHGSYDCITMWHVLEHVPDPRECVRQLRTMLAPGGTLVVAVPDFGGWQARLFGRHWLHLDVPRHLQHFTAFSLGKMLDEAGFQKFVEWHQEVEYDCFGWIQSALNASGRVPNVLFDSLTGKQPLVNRWEVAANYVAGTVMAGPALALTLISTLARKGGTLIVAVRPKAN
jgi:SAM-dependent methyltransferase